MYDKLKVKRDEVDSYEKLADARNKGRICIRSGSHPFNLSLFGFGLLMNLVQSSKALDKKGAS